MRALVTGGAGFIGSHLVDALIERGSTVTALDNLTTGSRSNLHPAATLIEADVRDRKGVQEAFEVARPEVVFHLAAQADVRRSMDQPEYDAEVNLIGTIHLLEAARALGVRRLVFSSTGGAVYGEPRSIPVAESHPIAPESCYGASKATAEIYLGLYARAYRLSTIVLRYANVYGPRQNPKGEAGVVAIFSRLLLAGQQPTVFGDGSKTRDYVYVDDVVRANLLAVDRAAEGAYNIGTGRQVTDQEVFDAVARAVGCAIEPHYGEKRAGEIDHIALDASLADRTLGWSPSVRFEDGIARAVDYYRALATA